MVEDTSNIGPHRRFVFTDDGVRFEKEVRGEVGLTWKSVADLDVDELAQLNQELEDRGML